MIQRQVTHPAGTFAACASCGKEPHHYVGSGSTLREPVRFAVITDRHQLGCACHRTTGWLPTLTAAQRAWGELGETLPLPLRAVSNVRQLRRGAMKGRARA